MAGHWRNISVRNALVTDRLKELARLIVADGVYVVKSVSVLHRRLGSTGI
jgi:hypothetical protein